MGDQKRPLRPGEAAPGFELATANFDGTVSFADLRGRPFLIGFFRGLHCPFCRRQLEQLASVEPTLRAAGVETVAVINTPVERARLYFRHRPTPITLLCDPDCRTHRAYGVPHAEFLPDGSRKQPEWPYGATMAQFQAARINPTGELPEPLHPMEANTILNAKDRFELTEADHAIFANHATQLVGHFLVNANGTIGWVRIEALDGPNSLSVFPTTAEIIAAAGNLGH
ncbi:redoxin domain-containing protein [Rhizobium sp. L43]|uniref:redoxin domain-containing protein n=1 Tax=Rhizobium sp. L43 TaxID=2035452 RepID=UPI000BE96C49|nr:redoxin domain-containing protein [Rhizobium sp. L43]PDS81466.1 peroxiredoxin [Rhizobium sp. L43]